jgi:hypothetical protein
MRPALPHRAETLNSSTYAKYYAHDVNQKQKGGPLLMQGMTASGSR